MKRGVAVDTNSLVGQRFGRLVVIERSKNWVSGPIKWLCQCDCGATCEPQAGNLKSGKAQSCGCYRREQVSKLKGSVRPPHVDLTGKIFGRWTVIGFSGRTKARDSKWLCRCSCGIQKNVSGSNLTKGWSKSCGCYREEKSRETVNGFRVKGHPLYSRWGQMLSRCSNPQHFAYPDYGGRGVKVCERWHDFMLFLDDMSPGWRPGLTLDRINVDGNYEPGNCRWSDSIEQMTNRRTSKLIDTPWGQMTIGAAAKKLGMSYVPMQYRVKRWPKERWFEPKS